MITHVRMEVITGAARADAVAEVILGAACTGTRGDGLLAIIPVERVLRARTRSLARRREL